ncbi:MAG TPA: DoxX family protein [Granulicella sp.]|jgi:uncharacterized membrane protein YphA (DoxX/SURF4 family)
MQPELEVSDNVFREALEGWANNHSAGHYSIGWNGGKEATTMRPRLEAQQAASAVYTVFLRLALAISFLSAVADRFGLWGKHGEPHVAWGDFSHFILYTQRLTSIFPVSFVPALAWTATLAETILGLALLVGWRTRFAALLSGVLLLVFAISMTCGLGIKAPLDFSVFTASAGAFLLSNCNRYPFSLDAPKDLRANGTRYTSPGQR